MATSQKLRTNGATHRPPAQSSATSDLAPEDKALLKFVRGNAQPMIAALSRAASEAGTARSWTAMNESLTLAMTLAKLCPAPADASPPMMSQTAAA